MTTAPAKVKEMTAQGRVESVAASGNAAMAQQADAAVVDIQRIRKITSKLFKDIKIGLENGVKVAGQIIGHKIRNGEYGEYAMFLGTFRLVVGDSIYMADELILPSFPETVLLDSFKTAFNSSPEGTKSIEVVFAITIWKKDDSKNTRNARGFTWEVAEILKMATPTAATDPYLKLLA
jgi:hypothetical protein